MTFAIITNFNIHCLAHTKTIVIIRNQILLLLCHLKDCSSGYKSGVWFIQAVRKFQELTRILKKKKLKEEKLLYIFLLKALSSGLTPSLSILLHLNVVHWKYSYMYTYIWGFLGFFCQNSFIVIIKFWRGSKSTSYS